MNPAFVYRQHGRSIFWIAFMSALAIHLGAVALAKTKSPPATLEDFNPPGDVELVDTAEPEPALLEESATPPPLEQVHPDQDIFREENLTPPPVRAHRKARLVSLVTALLAVLAVVGAVVFSSNESRISAPTGSSLSHDLAGEHANQFAPVEAEDAARLSQNEKFDADAGPYAFTGERPFVSVMSRPRSNVPLVVNSLSYLDVRRSINAGLLPPRESVRIEGMINHFPYEYPQPTAGEPFSLNLDVVTCPWEPTHRLVRIGLKGHQDVAVRADSRIEVEFNPRRVASYRLIGYDRQKAETQNSNEDNVGSHPIAAGYTLTTLYEVVPLKRVGTAAQTQMPTVAGEASEPLLTAKLQLKTRGNDAAVGFMQRTLSDTGFDFAAAPSDLKFAAAVAEFGMILRDSEYKGNGSLQQVIEWAQQGAGADMNGYRADFIELVRKAQALKKS